MLVRDFWLDVVDVVQILRRLGHYIPNLNCRISKDILSHRDLGGTVGTLSCTVKVCQTVEHEWKDAHSCQPS